MLALVFFVSLVRIVAPGTLAQLLVGLMVSMSILIYQLTARPYKLATDNFLGLLGGVAYALLLLGALTLKMGSLFETLGDQLSPQLQQIFRVPATPLIVVLLTSTLTSVAFATAVLLREALRDWRQPKLRFAGSHTLVSLPLLQGKTHHLFISHYWKTAQDQARVLRSRLQAMVPGLQVWLDVEDLEDISALEEAIDSVQAVLVIVSAGYFQVVLPCA